MQTRAEIQGPDSAWEAAARALRQSEISAMIKRGREKGNGRESEAAMMLSSALMKKRESIGGIFIQILGSATGQSGGHQQRGKEEVRRPDD
ncbi:hypothetical protein scyTo_0005135 [Scyliorhinus torazame]|uniref:Uncharacterized protein n=1 Tax=Scyliorhinus torazame TaxID=75743 RepID=A0A401P2U4_SCYTO|nr:hypothetical protein [Scyliorhinus torazame]